ncbi:MAG: hypothetical protein H2172_11565 [Opitutus sp.]|nr:hypothetical protein [Opitutus sp.]MCS6247915.1 hypothetical protein [Opitutus sp.]MCS6276986.1 hypothetical protein [Opitutus sp.]MCS6299966.1 hypothetical protein [Opitutus sp.]
MEEIGQIFVELFLQLFFEVFADAIWRRLPEPARVAVKVVLSSAFAVLIGWVSVTLKPDLSISSESLRIVYLIFAPVLVGIVMSWIGRFFVSREKPRSILERFAFGWLFAFSFALTRYLLIK